MRVLASVFLVLCLWGEGLVSLAQQDGRESQQQFLSPETYDDGNTSVDGLERRGHRPGGHHGSGSSKPTSIKLSPGDSRWITSRRFRPSWREYRHQTWNVQATGSPIEVMCLIWFPTGDCDHTSLTIGEHQVCSRYVGQIVQTTAEDDILMIAYKTKGGRRGFTCIVSESPIDWSYSGSDGPDQWSQTYTSCGGSSQSPINIDTNKTLGQFPWKELGIHEYETASGSMKLTNNRRSAVLTTEGPFVMGGNLPLNEQYLLQEVVFHWGPTDSSGSEHTVDGQSYAGEIQLVHYNSKYGNYEAALKEADGLVILSVLLEISSNENEKLTPIISALRNIRSAGSSTNLRPFPIGDLLPDNHGDFYRYQGSLTTPGCDESVTWTIFENPIDISSSQLAQFRKLKDEEGNKIINNGRPIQSLNGRNVSEGQLIPTWSHNGPDGQDVWATEISASCGGDKQSPINIETSSTVTETSWAPIVITNFDKVPDSMALGNNDHGAVVTATMDYKATVEGGPFETPYTFFHYHFHFGSPNSNGSEHTIDGRRYPGEIHMIIYNDSLGGFGPALAVEKGLYEVSIFLDLSPDDNSRLASVISGLENVVPSQATTELTPFPLEYLLPDNLQDYYWYDGSFTAPNCDETVYFLIFKDPILASRNQMERLYNLKNAAGYNTQDGFRRLQPLNNRTVYQSP